MNRHVPALAGLLLIACSDSLTEPPFYGEPLARSATTLAGVDVVVSADRVVVAPGDSVHFTVTATNRSSVRVQLGEQCEPSMDVVVMAPTGREQSALIGDRAGVAFGCPLPADFFADPGVSRALRIAWRAPDFPGVYQARGALRRGDGLGNESPPLAVTVH